MKDSSESEDVPGYFQPRVMRHTQLDGSVAYAIHDVYFRHDGTVSGYTEAARSPRERTIGALKTWIENAAARNAPAICGDLGYQHDPEHFNHWLKHIDEPPLAYE